jgi:radical SAM superfamily enzyme YgiQ (UPF0313 family)
VSWQQVAQVQHLLENEQGTIRKDWGGRLPIALVFPNTYYVGMSSLALHSLYRLWNARDDSVCERVFNDARPPTSLESGAPLDYFPVVAFSVSYEMDYFNVVDILRSAGLPLRSGDRDEVHPLIVAGGPAVSANPEPLAPLLDAILIGEVEPVVTSLTEALHLSPNDRSACLSALDALPGFYVPVLHSPSSERQPVARQWLPDLDSFPTGSVVLTPGTEFADIGLIEIARGCGRGCRFCLAGYSFRPPRERSGASILDQSRELLRRTDRLGLVSAAVSDHSAIDEIAVELRRLGARLSVSSMRVDPVSEPLLQALAESGTRTLTIAPEAGSERLRQAINKTQSEEDVLNAAELAARLGIPQLKLYFMLGLPSETEDDMEALVNLAVACADRFRRQVTVNLTPFVPKAHTPFQRLAQPEAKSIKRRVDYVKRQLGRRGIAVRSESPAWAEVQGTLARGDRQLAEVLASVDHVSPAAWRRALMEAGLPMQELLRERGPDEPLPWDFVRSGVTPSYLSGEARRAETGRLSPPCPPGDCVACGVCIPQGQAVPR